ncbi:MAG: DNA-binding protein [Chlorobi bacterium]|nr:DNA-binding protein [Chlorobiota bacterium]
MKIIFTIIVALVFISTGLGQDDAQFNRAHAGIHKVIVTKVLQTDSYTYLLVKENDKTQWLAMPKIEAKPGEVYYYQGGNEMKDFKSSQLNRTFESVLFLGGVVKADDLNMKKKEPGKGKTASDKKLELSLEPVTGGLTISELLANKSKYAGKTVKVKGKVTQFSSGIMKRNWIHLQDGTEYDGKYDLVVTTQSNAVVGDTVVFEGTITLDKDFGFGYFYDLIMENAQKIQ